jgi:hypothetical protein
MKRWGPFVLALSLMAGSAAAQDKLTVGMARGT